VGRRELWHKANELLDLNLPFLLAGDFNCITESEEKLGGAPFEVNQDVREFRSFIAQGDLTDLGFAGPCVTWCNKQAWIVYL